MTDENDVMGTKEAAEALGVSVRTVQLWVEKGLLPAWKTAGGHRRISRASVEALQRAHSAGQSAAPGPANLAILVVEDDPTMQAYYAALIEILRPDATLQIAENGFDGLVRLGKTQPRLMLVDVDMPGMDGIEMLKSISKLDLANDCLKAVVTSLGEEELALRGGVPEGIPVYSKPLGADDLGQLIDQVGEV